MDDTSRQVVERFYAGLSTGRMELELLDSDLEWITPATLPWTPEGVNELDGTVRYRGFEEFGRYLQSLLAAVEDMRAVAHEILPIEDGRVLVLGDEIGVSIRSGKEFRAPFAHLLEVSGGKITRLRGYVDTARMRAAFI